MGILYKTLGVVVTIFIYSDTMAMSDKNECSDTLSATAITAIDNIKNSECYGSDKRLLSLESHKEKFSYLIPPRIEIKLRQSKEKIDTARSFSMPEWAKLDADRNLERYLAKQKKLIMDGARQTREYLAKRDRLMP